MTGMVPVDVYALTGAGDPRLSPDGRTVAYTVGSVDRDANTYRSAIWMAAVGGSEPPRRFTSGDKRDGSPRWSPDGRWIAFVSSRAEDKPQLFVIPATGGEARKLTERKEGVDDPRWSPDGTRILFGSRCPDPAYDQEDQRKRQPRRFTRLGMKLDNEGWIGDRPQHLFVVSVDGDGDGVPEPVQITDGEHQDGSASWSPDGTRVAFVSGRHEGWDIDQSTDIYLVDAGPDGPAEPTRLTDGSGTCDAPAWSPDGSQIAYLYTPGVLDFPHHGQVAVSEPGSGRRRILTASLDRTCAPYPLLREPAWDGSDLVFALEDHGNVHLYGVPADGGAPPSLLVGGERVITGFDVAGGTIVHTATGSTTLPELFVGDRRLTSVGDAFVAGREICEPERFTAVSKDGSEVDAWIIRPAGFEPGTKYPLLLNIHGGPFTQYSNLLFNEFQVYAGAGYAVVYCNPRGSSGSTEAWGRAINGPSGGLGPGWGTLDYEDVMAAVDTALERYDFLDPERMGVMGGSYGGFMTSWIVGHTDRFACAISERACNQWVAMWGSSDIGWLFKGEIGAYVFEDPDAYMRMSPATYGPNITTPLMILHSENDLRCPIEQGEHLFAILRVLKRDVEMVRFPEEGHELTRSGSPAHRVMRFEIVLEFLAKHLKPGEHDGAVTVPEAVGASTTGA